jgi:hypothetical protein
MVQWRKLKGGEALSNPLHRWLAWFDRNSSPELIEEVLKMDDAIMAANNRYLETADSAEKLKTATDFVLITRIYI